MDKMIANCGIVCSECPAFIATKNNDEEGIKKTAEMWSKQFGGDIKPEHVWCDGCISKGDRHCAHWSECEIRICCHGKELANCAECDDYACEKLEAFFKFVPDAKKTLEELKGEL